MTTITVHGLRFYIEHSGLDLADHEAADEMVRSALTDMVAEALAAAHADAAGGGRGADGDRICPRPAS